MRHFVSRPKSSNTFIIERCSDDLILFQFLKAFSKAIEVRLDIIKKAVADIDSYYQVLAPKEIEVIVDLYNFVRDETLRMNLEESSPERQGASVFTYSNLNTGACVSLIFLVR